MCSTSERKVHGASSRNCSVRDLIQGLQIMGLELSPPSPVPPMADITSSSWCPTEPKCHLRNLSIASVLMEVGSQGEPTHLSCMNPFLSFLQGRILGTRWGSGVPRGAH